MGSARRSVTIELHGYIPTLNEYINAQRQHRLRGAKMKKMTERRLVPQFLAQKIKPFEAVELDYDWVRLSKREDKDNIAFGQKFVQDAMVTAGVVSDDGWNKVIGFIHKFSVDKSMDYPKLILIIRGSVGR